MTLINNATNKKRRRRTNETAANKRSQALDSNGAMVLINIQNHIDEALVAFTASLYTILMTAYAWAFEIFDDAAGFAFIQQALTLAVQIQHRIMHLMILDSQLADIEPEDELPRGHSLEPRRYPRIDDYNSDDQAMINTNFRCGEIRILYNFFQLGGAAEGNGFINIHGYLFHPEEILIYVLEKFNDGQTNVAMARNKKFGGDSTKRSRAMDWLFHHIQHRIQSFVSLNMLERYRLVLDQFAKQIANRIETGFNVEDPITGDMEFVEGISYDDDVDPFRVFGFVDCTLNETSTPGTGPRGRHEGTLMYRVYFIIIA